LRELKANRWQTRICFLTEDQIPRDVLAAEKDGAAVFVNERFPEDLRDRLREIATELVSRPSPSPNRSATIHRPISPRTGAKRHLTFRQNQIVTMLKIGSSNREIARVLGVSEGTIKVHLHRIYQRIGVSNRTQLATQSFTTEKALAPLLKPGEFRKI